jgi:hypothetical protein
MSEGNGHHYEAKVWQHEGVWKARLLRDGMAWSLEEACENREAALEWARAEAEKSRAANVAESKAERVEV